MPKIPRLNSQGIIGLISEDMVSLNHQLINKSAGEAEALFKNTSRNGWL